MSQSVRQGAVPLRSLLERRFYFFMSLFAALVVAYGFHFTVDAGLIHPAIRPPAILWVHAATNVSWLMLFIAQTGLVTTRNVALHKRVGVAGIALGVMVFVVGVSTTAAMIRFHAAHPAPPGAGAPPSFAIIPFEDMATFAGLFATAVALRRRDRESHRRLMLMATCALTGAGWGRFPTYLVPDNWFYVPADLMVVMGMARDYLVMRRVHPAYLYGLPAMIAMQAASMAIMLTAPAWWMNIVRAIASW